MIMSDTQAKLDAAQIKRNAIFADIESLTANEKKADAEIEALKAKLAEEQKPKLRHGDYGYDKDGDPCLYLCAQSKDRGDGPMRRCSSAWLYEYEITGDNFKIVTVIGNIFDDLKALQEDVTEFKVGNGEGIGDEADGYFNARFDGRHVWLKVDDDGLYFEPEDISIIILNLRQMEATLKRRSKN
jgi:hypothetical protein